MAAVVGWAAAMGGCASAPRSAAVPAIGSDLHASPARAASARAGESKPGDAAPPHQAASALHGPPASPPAPRASADDPRAAVPTLPDEQRAPPFQLAWARRGIPKTKSVVIAPWGDVVALGSRKLGVYAGDTGDPMADKAICYTFRQAFGFVGPRTGVLVCEDSLKVFTFPGLAYRGVRGLPGKARTAAFGERVVAVGFAEGPVRVYETDTWTQVAYFALGERPSTLAISPDGSTLAVALRNGRLVLCTVRSKQQRSLQAAGHDPQTVLAFSPDGTRLLAAGPNAAVLWKLTDAVPERSWEEIRGVTAARWISDDRIAVAREAGVVVLDRADGAAHELAGAGAELVQPPLELALSADQRVLCLAAEEGALRCLSRGPVRSTSARASGAAPSAATGQDPRPVMPGRIVGHTGHHLQVRALPHAKPPDVGTEASLLRHVLHREGELTTYGWPEIARVRVDVVHQDRLTLTIVADQSEGVLDDSVRDPFEYDTPIRLVWDPR